MKSASSSSCMVGSMPTPVFPSVLIYVLMPDGSGRARAVDFSASSRFVPLAINMRMQGPRGAAFQVTTVRLVPKEGE